MYILTKTSPFNFFLFYFQEPFPAKAYFIPIPLQAHYLPRQQNYRFPLQRVPDSLLELLLNEVPQKGGAPMFIG